jgi:hypothetical protein
MRVELHPSARRHGVPDKDIAHAFKYRMVEDFLGDEPERWLVIAPTRLGTSSNSWS